MARQNSGMSDYKRPRQTGSTVFFTVNVVDRGSDLLIRHIAVLRDAAKRTKADKPFPIDAWVVLPDHMHCIWTLPAGDADYSNRMGMLKARFSRELGRSGHAPTLMKNTYGAIGGRERTSDEKRVGACPDLRKNQSVVWQKRFWEHHIRDEADYLAHIQYCWQNPVKHRLAERPEDWPYSSYHRDMGH